MTVEELKKLQPGDRVLIVNERTDRMNDSGLMDKWLGKTMTVAEVMDEGEVHSYVTMEEDFGEWYGDHWSWYPEMIEFVVAPDSDYDCFDASPIFSML